MGVPGWAAGTRPIRAYRPGNNKGDGWAMTPKWHPRRWLGFTWRRWEWDDETIGGPYDGVWHYQNDQERARCALAEVGGYPAVVLQGERKPKL